MKKILCLLAVLALVSCIDYPEFTQCDERWGDEILGSGPSTICDIGCLISSVSMFLNKYGVVINGQLADPGLLNTWLDENNGYNGENFLWASQAAFGFNYLGEFAPSEVTSNFDQGNIVILHVDHGHHYVLMNGYEGETFYVNDPYYPVTYYTLSDVVACNIFSVPAEFKNLVNLRRNNVSA